MPDPDFPLPDTRRTLPMALLHAREQVMDRFRPLLHAIDVTEAQWRVLRMVQERGTTEARALAREACILAPSLTRVLRTLERRGLVTVEKSSEDRRRLLITLTERGGRLLADAAGQSAAIHAEIRAVLGAEAMDALLDALDTMRRRLDRTTPVSTAGADVKRGANR